MYRQVQLSACFFLSVVLTSPTVAQTPVHEPEIGRPQAQEKKKKRTNPVVRRWQEEILAIEKLILQNQAREALQRGNRLAREMLRLIKSGDGVGRALGSVNTLRAIAATMTGDERLGLWHWHIAVQMFPELKKRDISYFGEAGRFLMNHPPRTDLRQPSPQAPNPVSLGTGKVTKPKKKHAPAPKYPPGKRGSDDSSVMVIVQAIIDKSGKVRDPIILKSQGEFTMVCAALEALWRWEFEPATLDGEPIEVFYNLTFNFRSGY